MERHMDMDGDRWVARVDRQAAHPGMQAVVFHCVSDGQRPYRVIEVPADGEDRRETDYSERELREMFSNAQTMDYSRDVSAEPGRRGDGRWRLE